MKIILNGIAALRGTRVYENGVRIPFWRWPVSATGMGPHVFEFGFGVQGGEWTHYVIVK